MAPPGRGAAPAGTVRMAAGQGELASLVADAEREPSPAPGASTQGPRVLRVEVNGLLHDWFDVDEMGDFVRSAAFASTLRENVARYFGVPLEKQAIYDEDGLLTTSADFSRALQRVSPKLYVYDVNQMGQELRERTVEELEAIDQEVEQSWRHFGAYNARSRPASATALAGPSILPEKMVELGERGDKVLGPCVEPSCAEGDRGGTSGSWQLEQQVQLLPQSAAGTSTPGAPLPNSLLPAAQQRRSGSVVNLGPAPLGPEVRGRGTAEFGNTTPIAEYLKEAGGMPVEDHQAFSLFAPSNQTVPASGILPHGMGMPGSAPALHAEMLPATFRGGVRVLSAGPSGQHKAQQLHDISVTTDATNVSPRGALLNSSGSSRTLPGDASPLQPLAPAPQQAAGMRYVAGTISNTSGCLRATTGPEPAGRRPDGAAMESVSLVLGSTPPHSRPGSAPAPAAVASRAPSRERAAAPAGQTLVLRRAPTPGGGDAIPGARSPRLSTTASPPRATTPPMPTPGAAPSVTTPRLAVGARRRSTTPVPVVVSPVWGGRTVQQAQPPQQWAPLAQWAQPSSRTATPRRSITPTRREVPPLQGMPLGGPVSLAPKVRTVTPTRVAAASWRPPVGSVPNSAPLSLSEWSQVYQH